MEGLDNSWNDDIMQKRDIMIDIPYENYEDCYHALKEIEGDWMSGKIYFVSCLYNSSTIRMYIELRERMRLKLAVFEVKKVFRKYLISHDYVMEIKSRKILHEQGIFQPKISRVPKEDEINNMKVEDLAKLKPYLPTLINERMKALVTNKDEMTRVQNLPLIEDEGNMLFFNYVNREAKK